MYHSAVRNQQKISNNSCSLLFQAAIMIFTTCRVLAARSPHKDYSMRPQNYLNNKDILKEIHKSKTAYCCFTAPEYADYDIILSSVDEIPGSLLPTTEVITGADGNEKTIVNPPAAKMARAKRLTIAAQDASLLEGKKLKADEVGISADDIKDTDIVFRITSWAHIPEAPPSAPKIIKGKKSKAIIIDEDADIVVTEYDEEIPDIAPPSAAVKYVKLNFPPFLHYKLNDSNELEVIGKSHWKGDLETGSFNRDHGKITNKLALMYMKLCERYATRSNWRGYTYNDEMQAQALLQLAHIGLQFDESKSANPFAYYTAAITNSFTRVLNIEKKNQNIRDDILEMNNLSPSYSRQNSGMDIGHGADE